jgi:hypothetical protein
MEEPIDPPPNFFYKKSLPNTFFKEKMDGFGLSMGYLEYCEAI